MLDAQHSWTCHACTDDDHLDSHLNKASETPASAPSLTLLVGDHSHSKTQATQRRLTFHANKILCYVHLHPCSISYCSCPVSTTDQLVSVASGGARPGPAGARATAGNGCAPADEVGQNPKLIDLTQRLNW